MTVRFAPARNLLIAILAMTALVACSSTLAAPTPGAEFKLPNAVGPTRYNQQYTDICAGNGVYLAVWHDQRSGADFDVYGILLDVNGNPIGEESFLISKMTGGASAPNDQLYPGVGFNGTNFLVAWADKRAANVIPRIYASRVTPSGEVLDLNGIALPTAVTPTDQTAPQIASNGTDWMVVWQEKSSSGSDDIWGTVVSAAGTVGTRTAISNRTDNEQWPGIAWNGTNYLVVWQDYRNSESTGTDIYGVRLTSAGAKVAGSEKIISTAAGSTSAGAAGAQSVPSVAAVASSIWLIVWQDARGANSDIYCARMSSGGTVSDLGGVAVSTAANDQEEPRVTWDGTYFLAAWRDKNASYGIRASRITTNAAVLDPGGIAVINSAAGPYGPAVSGRDGVSLVAWYSLDISDSDIFGASVNSSGQVGALKTLSLSTQDQPTFDAAYDGTNYVVTWADRRSGVYRVYAARVSPAGVILDPDGVLVSATYTGSQTEPTIAWDGTQFLVAWTELGAVFTDIKGMRLSPTLARLDATPLNICNIDLDQKSPTVAWNGANFLVAWVDYRGAVAPDYFSDIRGARVSPAGVVTAIGTAISGAADHQFAPSAASCGGNWLVAWEDYRTNSSPVVYCTRVTGAGSVQDVAGIVVPSYPYWQVQPRVTTDGTNYFIVWSDKRDGWSNDNIYGVRMSTSAVRLDPADLLICGATSSQTSPSAAWNGQKYVVAWQDSRTSSISSSDIYLKQVTSAGAVDPTDALISGGIHAEMNPRVIAPGPGAAAVFYSNFISGTYRTVGRTLVEAPPVPVVSDDGAITTSSSSLHATWHVGGREAEVLEYRYTIGTTPGASDVVPWTSAGTNTGITHTGLSLVDGQTYYFAVQSRVSADPWSGSGVSDGIMVDASAPTTPIVTDDGQYTSSLDSLHATWTSSDPQTGIAQYQYAIGTSSGGTDVVGWTSVGTNSSVTKTGLTLSEGATYFMSVKALNGAGLWSIVGSSDGITVEASAPTTPVLTDDGEYTSSQDTLHATWASSDPHSGIAEYQYAIGTTAGATDVAGWTSTGTTPEVTKTGLSLSDGTTYFFSVKAKNGADMWSDVGSSDGITVDASAPTTPTVTDDGDFTLPDMLHASWSAEDPHSGIAEYRYAIGTTAGGNDIVDWTSAGADTEVTKTGLSLSQGVQYFVSVKALNGAGLWSDAGSSDGISVAADAGTILQAKALADGAGLILSHKVVTAGADNLPNLGGALFYIEEADRTSGIKIMSDEPINAGSIIDVAGEIELVDGERQITASAVKVVSTGNQLPRPFNMRGRAIGGVDFNEHTPGVYNGEGPNNLGLYIMTWGKVTYTGGEGDDFFYANPGTFLRDGSGYVGVKIRCRPELKPTVGSTVIVTGISSCEPLDENSIRRVLATQVLEYSQ